MLDHKTVFIFGMLYKNVVYFMTIVIRKPLFVLPFGCFWYNF